MTGSVESSLLMWALGALIVWMAAHVMLGWMRQAQEEWEWDWTRMRQVAIGGATFGTALSVGIPLGLAGEALSFPVGYNLLAALGLWLGAVGMVTLLALVPVWREEGVTATGAGVLMGLLITALQAAWVMAVGFRPGVQWDPVFVGAAAVVSALGVGTALALAFPYGERARDYRYSWRIAAAGLIGLSFLAGYALLLYAADLPTQIGSVYRHELPGSVISLVGGGLLPLMLLLMVLDLESRRRQRRRQLRTRRRGSYPVFGSESVTPPMDMQPSHHRVHTAAPAEPASVPASPPPLPTDAPAAGLAPLSTPATLAPSAPAAQHQASAHEAPNEPPAPAAENSPR